MKYYKGLSYQLAEDYTFRTKLRPREDINLPFITLTKDGLLTGKRGYAWDGVSGGVDTDSLMVPTLYHDMGYQLLRLGFLHPKWKSVIDDVFKKLYAVRVAQLPWYKRWFGNFREEYIYLAVDKLGKSSTLPENIREVHEVG